MKDVTANIQELKSMRIKGYSWKNVDEVASRYPFILTLPTFGTQVRDYQDLYFLTRSPQWKEIRKKN